MKKALLTVLLISTIATSYADDNAPSDSQNNGVTYNNLTNNFVHQSKKKAAETEPNPWMAMVGVAAGLGPKYPGSNTMTGESAFAISASYKNRFFINNNQGLGVNFINTKPWIVGTAINYSYDNNFRADEYPGLSNPKSAFVGSLFANYTVSLYNFGVAGYKTIGQLQGAGYYQATMTRAVPLSQHLIINLTVGAQYDDATYMQSLYGVTHHEAASSNLPRYATQSGWDNISYGITPMYSINKHWILTGAIAGVTYLDQVAKSPLITHKQNYAAAIGFIYNIF